MSNRIALIATGPSLLSKKGPLIDSFGKVVRMGRSILKGYEEHVGERTDIFCAVPFKIAPVLDAIHNGYGIKSLHSNYPEVSTFDACTLLNLGGIFHIDRVPEIWWRDDAEKIVADYINKLDKHGFGRTKEFESLFKGFMSLDKKHRYSSKDYRLELGDNLKMSSCNSQVIPTSGISFLHLATKIYAKEEIVIGGFDFLSGGCYWNVNLSHFKNHPSFQEMLFVQELKKSGKVLFLGDM